jgi:single-strand DNA-binding protein
MAGETQITLVGNLTADPELRYTQAGAAVASFTVASTPKTVDKQSGQWKDGDALFLRCSVWREFAEHVSKSLTKGMRVIAQGRLRQRSYQDREGNNRTSYELDIDEVGPSLRYATAAVARAPRSGGSQPAGGAFGAAQVQPPRNDAAARQAANERGWGATVDDGWNSSTPIDGTPF